MRAAAPDAVEKTSLRQARSEDMPGQDDRRLIAARIREARRATRLTQAAVAAEMKLARVAITLIETGKRNVTAEEILRFSTVFGVSPLFLLGRSPQMVATDDPQLQSITRELGRLQPAAMVKLLELLKTLRKGDLPEDSQDR